MRMAALLDSAPSWGVLRNAARPAAGGIRAPTTRCRGSGWLRARVSWRHDRLGGLVRKKGFVALISEWSGPREAEESRPVDALDLYECAGVGSIDDLAAAQVQGDVMDGSKVVEVGCVEHQIARSRIRCRYRG